MRNFKRVVAMGLSVAMTVGTLSFAGYAAGLPTTDGHDKYIDKKVFNVISSEDFGKEDLSAPLFDKSIGSSDISDLQVPTLAYDDTSIGIVWKKPEKYDNVADYNVYVNGVKQETARENFKSNAEWAAKYMEAFYDYYNTQGKSDVDMVDVDIHSYRATELTPDTEYTFMVVAVDANGNELGIPKSITVRTTKVQETFNILDYGAKTSVGYTTYDDEINTFIEANTKAIQAAIDACTPGGKVLIPEGTFVSGALWLKSNMTLEINGTLWASPNSDHFDIGFLMYPFYTDTRGWGLINAMSADESQPLENIRVTGNGTVYGNGWKYGSGDSIYQDGYTRNAYKLEGDLDVSLSGNEKYSLPRWVAGSNTKVYYYGIQAADSAKKYLSNVFNEDGSRKYSDAQIESLSTKIKNNNKDGLSDIDSEDKKNAYATRSSLVIMRNVTNVYIGDVTIENPANHSVNILDSRNIATTNVKVLSYDGNNADGLGFGCSQNVICWNNFTDTGDDNLGFGASVGEAARDCNIQTNSEVWMFNNYLHEGHGGLAAGSHTSNGIQDVLFEDTVMNNVDMAFRFKSAPTNGGFIANITMRDCAVANTNQGWVLTTSYSDPNSASSTEAAEIGSFYNFAAYNVSIYGTTYNNICVYADVDPDFVENKPWHTHNHLYFQDITFGNVGTNKSWDVKNSNGGWDSLTGCENAVFYNVKTVSYNKNVSSNYQKAWSNIKYSKNIRFQGTTLDSLSAQKDIMNNAMQAPVWENPTFDATSSSDGQSAFLSWTAATDNAGVTYTVETYIGETLVDSESGIDTNSINVTGLSSGVTYLFKVYASDETGNKTEGPKATLTTSGSLDTNPIVAPSSNTVSTSNPLYTAGQITWQAAGRSGEATNGSKVNNNTFRTGVTVTDPRVRGYKIYVNGNLQDTYYNYQLNGGKENTGTGITNYNRVTGLMEKYSVQVGRLTPGIDNTIKVVAFTDSGVEYPYNEVTIKTLTNYDYKAPVFAADAKVTAIADEAGDVVLTWDAATDDTAVGGYRIYVDGTPVYRNEGDVFKPINGTNTTDKTTYAIKGLDLTRNHVFTIQAGDTWWKAAQTMGTYDKMAGYNWTVTGIYTVLTVIPEETTTAPEETMTAPEETTTAPEETMTVPEESTSEEETSETTLESTLESVEPTTDTTDRESYHSTEAVESSTESSQSSANTGDSHSIWLYVIIMGVSFGVGYLVLKVAKKRI